MKPQATIALCTNVMNRMQDLRSVLPQNLAALRHLGQARYVILDYCSTDALCQWILTDYHREISSGLIELYSFTGRSRYHPAHAKNLAHIATEADILCNLDADAFIDEEFLRFMLESYSRSRKVIGCACKWHEDAPPEYVDLPKGHGGRIFLSRESFLALRGYDEKFLDYGAEDKDFVDRALRFGLDKVFIPAKFLRNIVTEPKKRTENMRLDGIDSEREWKEQLKKNEQLVIDNYNNGVIIANPSGWATGEIRRIMP